MKLNSACSPAGGEASLASGTRGALPLPLPLCGLWPGSIRREWPGSGAVAIGRMGVIIIEGGVTAGKASHNTSNARVVTAGKMGRNSSQ